MCIEMIRASRPKQRKSTSTALTISDNYNKPERVGVISLFEQTNSRDRLNRIHMNYILIEIEHRKDVNFSIDYNIKSVTSRSINVDD